MRAMQKLVRNGNSTQITIPRAVLIHLGWLPGQPVILELLEDNSLHIRLPVLADIAPIGRPRLVFGEPEKVAK